MLILLWNAQILTQIIDVNETHSNLFDVNLFWFFKRYSQKTFMEIWRFSSSFSWKLDSNYNGEHLQFPLRLHYNHSLPTHKFISKIFPFDMDVFYTILKYRQYYILIISNLIQKFKCNQKFYERF